MTLTAIDNECTEDMAIAIGEIVARSIARAFAKNEDTIGFLGDGGTYFGFVGIGQALLNVSDTITKVLGIQVQATAGAWAIDKSDILAMVGRLGSEADDLDAKFYGHRNFYYGAREYRPRLRRRQRHRNHPDRLYTEPAIPGTGVPSNIGHAACQSGRRPLPAVFGQP